MVRCCQLWIKSQDDNPISTSVTVLLTIKLLNLLPLLNAYETIEKRKEEIGNRCAPFYPFSLFFVRFLLCCFLRYRMYPSKILIEFSEISQMLSYSSLAMYSLSRQVIKWSWVSYIDPLLIRQNWTFSWKWKRPYPSAILAVQDIAARLNCEAKSYLSSVGSFFYYTIYSNP